MIQQHPFLQFYLDNWQTYSTLLRQNYNWFVLFLSTLEVVYQLAMEQRWKTQSCWYIFPYEVTSHGREDPIRHKTIKPILVKRTINWQDHLSLANNWQSKISCDIFYQYDKVWLMNLKFWIGTWMSKEMEFMYVRYK